MKLYLIGSRARGDNANNSDFDFLTFYDLEDIKKFFDIKELYKNGSKYIQFKTIDDDIVDIWKCDKKYLQSNLILRKMDKGHFIGLAKAIQKLGAKLNFNGVKINDKIYPIKRIINSTKQLENFKKYI
jgi:hypothetical protein